MHGVGDVVKIEGRFTAQKYVDLLENFFLNSLQERNVHAQPEPIIFVQDRSPIHMARVVKEWFAGRDDLVLLEWPSKGCGLNPIEHVWAYMVNGWESESEKRPHELEVHIKRDWESLRQKPHIIEHFVSSMPKRLQEVREREGGWTHY